jgi:hypothetical protein
VDYCQGQQEDMCVFWKRGLDGYFYSYTRDVLVCWFGREVCVVGVLLDGSFYSSIRGGIHLQVCLPPEAFIQLASQRGQLWLQVDRDVLEDTNC